MICFVCQLSLSYISQLIIHLKLYHCLKPNSTYECVKYNCYQTFSNVNSFKRHIQRKHNEIQFASPIATNFVEFHTNLETRLMKACQKNEDINENVEVCTQSSDELNVSEFEVMSILENENTNVTDGSLELIQKSMIEFSLELHSHSNLTRKDIANIIKKLEMFVFSPILSSLTQFTTNDRNLDFSVYFGKFREFL